MSERDPLLPWLIFTGLCLFAFILLWYFGLIQRMISGDRTYISSIIAVLYVASSLHCLWRILAVSREGAAAQKTGQRVVALNLGGAQVAFTRDGNRLLVVRPDRAFMLHAPPLEQLNFDWLAASGTHDLPRQNN